MTKSASEISTREEVTIMVVTTVIEFACAFGALVLVVFGWLDVARGDLRPIHLIALPVSFGLTLWTGYHAMLLICRPNRTGFIGVLLRALLAVVPLVAMDLL